MEIAEGLSQKKKCFVEKEYVKTGSHICGVERILKKGKNSMSLYSDRKLHNRKEEMTAQEGRVLAEHPAACLKQGKMNRL